MSTYREHKTAKRSYRKKTNRFSKAPVVRWQQLPMDWSRSASENQSGQQQQVNPEASNGDVWRRPAQSSGDNALKEMVLNFLSKSKQNDPATSNQAADKGFSEMAQQSNRKKPTRFSAPLVQSQPLADIHMRSKIVNFPRSVTDTKPRHPYQVNPKGFNQNVCRNSSPESSADSALKETVLNFLSKSREIVPAMPIQSEIPSLGCSVVPSINVYQLSADSQFFLTGSKHPSQETMQINDNNNGEGFHAKRQKL